MSGADWGAVCDAGECRRVIERYPRSRFIVPAAPSCHADRAHVDALKRAGIPEHALFELDLRKAADAGRPTHWRDFCAFVEIWSSCKTQNLARVASSGVAAAGHLGGRGGPGAPLFCNTGTCVDRVMGFWTVRLLVIVGELAACKTY